MTLKIVSRSKWGGTAPPPDEPRQETTVKHVIYTHNTPTEKCFTSKECIESMKQLDEHYIKEEGFTALPFHFLIGNDGNVYEGRGWDTPSCKSLKYYSKHHGDRVDIAYIGDYRGAYNSDMAKAAEELIDEGIKDRFIAKHPTILQRTK